MALAEDAASVLEQFVQDVANLPAEIAHLLEEIQAKDRTVAEHRSLINARDTSIQKHLKSQNFNCANPHPKDEAYCKTALASYDRAQAAQDEKVALSEKAALLLDRQIKRLDFKIRDLQNEGAIQPDPQLPSLLTNTSLSTRLPPLSSATSTGTSTPLHPLGGGAGPSTTIANNPLTRLVQPPNSGHRHPSPLPSTANQAQAHNLSSIRQANRRSPSTDPSKRRRLNPHHLNAPATSSSLRQSSLGPGTPKGNHDGASRGSSAGPARPPKKGGPASRTGTGLHNSTSANAANASTSGSSGATTKKAQAAAAAAARRRANKKASTPASNQDNSAVEDEDVEMEDVEEENEEEGEEEEEDEEEDDGADDKKYCTCRSVSYGNMVACDNDACPYEWFHWSCVGIKAEPAGKWFCPDCRTKTREGRAWNESIKGH